MANLVIRQAQERDRTAVLAFTQDTFQWGDYIYRVFDRWLADTSGKLLVAELDGKVIGLSFVKLTKEGEVWLQGGRVEKSLRRTGIGGAMIGECLRIAKEEMHAEIARVITDKTNLPPQRLLAKLGFNLATEFTELGKKVEVGGNQNSLRGVRFAEEEALPKIWGYLKSSPVFRRSSGLYTRWFVWYSLSKEELAGFVLNRNAVVYGPSGSIHGVMLIDDTTVEAKAERSIQTCYFDAEGTKGIEALSCFLLSYAANKGLEKIRLWTFRDERVVKSLRDMGFGGEAEESTELVWVKQL